MLANKISIYLSSKYILRGKAANSCSTGLPLQTLLEELRALLQTLSWIWGWEMKTWERKEGRNKEEERKRDVRKVEEREGGKLTKYSGSGEGWGGRERVDDGKERDGLKLLVPPLYSLMVSCSLVHHWLHDCFQLICIKSPFRSLS